MRIRGYSSGALVLLMWGASACSGDAASDSASGLESMDPTTGESTKDAARPGDEGALASGGDDAVEESVGDEPPAGEPAGGFAPDADDGTAVLPSDPSGPSGVPSAATPASGVGAAPLPMAPVAPPDGAAEPDEAEDEEIVEDPTEPLPEPTVPEPSPDQAGQLTAGVWDDNRNFERFMSFRDPMFDDQLGGLLGFDVQDHEAANAQFKELGAARETLDIALVIDTTGSMGDEMQFLQSEIRSISMRIEKVYPDAEQRWALIVYRDVGDEYVAQAYDFDTDPESFRTNLALQYVDGGGDFPEAPDAALAAMNELSWRQDDVNAKLAFWVADAPHHEERADDMTAAVKGSQALGIHVYPVASSGIDEFTELSMRSVAQLTGGRYIFLTDDSGIGGSHKEPTIPCYFVTRLDVAMLRMVDIEMSGEYKEPADDEIIRTGGNPEDGACELSSGDAVFVF